MNADFTNTHRRDIHGNDLQDMSFPGMNIQRSPSIWKSPERPPKPNTVVQGKISNQIFKCIYLPAQQEWQTLDGKVVTIECWRNTPKLETISETFYETKAT